MLKTEWDPPLSISTGTLVRGQHCEFNLYPRLALLPDALKKLPEAVGRVVGVELNMVGTDWPNKTAILMNTLLLQTMLRVDDEKGEISIHAPSGVDYMDKNNLETKDVWRGICRLCDTLPIAWVTYHADWFDPKDYAEFVRRHRRDLTAEILYENSDGRENERAVRTAEELRPLIDAEAKILLDWGHMAHAIEKKKMTADDVQAVLERYPGQIRAVHVSGVAGENGFHYPLDSPKSRGALRLLHENRSRLNGATVVLETPKRAREKLVPFIEKQVLLVRNPQLGLR